MRGAHVDKLAQRTDERGCGNASGAPSRRVPKTERADRPHLGEDLFGGSRGVGCRIRLVQQQQVSQNADAWPSHALKTPSRGHILSGMCGVSSERRCFSNEALVESLILAQDQRWRRA